jgi:hypothetical protein
VLGPIFDVNALPIHQAAMPHISGKRSADQMHSEIDDSSKSTSIPKQQMAISNWMTPKEKEMEIA